MADRRRAFRWGLSAEFRAAWLLRLKGYRILARRARTPVGEIDLVARRGGLVAFIEVKARRTLEEAQYAIQPAQRARIERAAEAFVARHPDLAGWRFASMRFLSSRAAAPSIWPTLGGHKIDIEPI